MNFYCLAISVLTILNACESPHKVDTPKYSILKRHILPDKIQETSGIIGYNGLIWTFNDSGGKPEIYGFNMSNDSIEQTIVIKNAMNNDWEDIAQDDQFIYIGDFGNNQGMRDSLVIYRISKSDIPSRGNAEVVQQTIVFSYPEYEPVTIPVSWSAFDCEAFVVVKDSLYLFTKDWTNGSTTIYRLPKHAGKFMAKKLITLDVQGLITGADYLDNTLILIGYSSFVPFILKYGVDNFNSISEKTGVRYELNDIATYQTEGICFFNEEIIISSEKTRSPAQIMELTLD
jgi:hypothetical protein